MLALTKDIIRYKCISYTTSLRMVKALGISEFSKVNKCILYVGPHQRHYKIQMYLYTTALRMVKDLGISECSKVNKCILHANPLHRSFLRYKCILFITAPRMVKAFGISG